MPNSTSSTKVKSESVDGVIIRLLGLTVGAELDYQTYFKILKNKLFVSRLGGKTLPIEEDQLLRDELKRVKREIDKTGGKRFKIKEGKAKVNTNNFSKSLTGGALVKSTKGKLNKDRFIFVTVKDITEKTSGISKENKVDSFDEIKKTLDSINEILKSKFKFDQKESEKERISKEGEKRKKRESTLEGFTKGIAGIVSATKIMLSPFQNVIDRILRFLFFTLLGRSFNKFMDWMKDKGNQEKFNAFVDFLSDHWPALAVLYILFGTSFGKLVRGLLKGAARMIVALAMNIGKIRKFIGKHKRLAFLGAAIAPLATRELGNIFGENKETPESGLIPKQGADLKDAQGDIDKIKQAPAPRLNQFNLGGMIPSFARGGFNPYGGMDFSHGVPITGAGQDDTLIAAKTGEAILTEKDQQDIGQRYVDRTTGEPLNIPQYLSGRKPGSVSMGNIRFPGFGGGFNLGGMVPKFNNGGIVGGIKNFFGNFGRKSEAKTISPKIKTPSWYGPAPIPDYQTPEAKALLKTIRFAEHYKGKNPYTSIYGGGSAPLTKMTIKEIIDMGNSGRLPKRFGGTSAGYGSGSAATGAYQFMPFTLNDLIRRGLAKPNEVFTPEVQDRLGWQLAANRGVSLNSLKRGGLTQKIMDKMAPEWASFPYSAKGGKSYYGQPVKPSDTLSKIYKQSLIKKQGGGLIQENTGKNISGTADRQLTALQPGEYVLPVDTVNRLGTSLIDKLVAMTDSNSTPFKRGVLNKAQITPYKNFGSSSGGMITLPPITSSTGRSIRPRASGLAGGSEVPDFSAVAPGNNRAEYASIYKLVG
jgi:muramidase (phage lysozyme)